MSTRVSYLDGGRSVQNAKAVTATSDRISIESSMLTGTSRTLTAAATLVALGFLGSRLLGALRAVIIANEYGTSAELDAFFVAQRLPKLVFQLLAGATLASAFIPVYARYISKRGEDEAWKLASTVLNIVLLATIVLSVIIFIFAEWIVPAMAPGLGEDGGAQSKLHEDAIFLTRVMLVSPILFAVSGMITGILNARHHFLLPAIAPMMYNISIILGAILLSDDFGTEALAMGVIVGSGLHLIVQLPALLKSGARLRLNVNIFDPGVREVLRLTGPRMIGLAAAQVNFMVLTFFGSFVGDSSISALNFAWLILLFPVGLFGMSLATAVFPALAAQAADGGKVAVQEMVARTLRFTLYLSLPATVGLILLREPLVRTLLERGAFDETASELVSSALLFYAIALAAHTSIEILSRGFYALGDTRTPVAFALTSMLINVVLATVLFESLELKGLALALSIATIVEAIGLFIVLNRRMDKSLWSRGMLSGIARIILATLLMTEALGFMLFILNDSGEFSHRSFFALIAGSTISILVYYMATLALRLPEAEQITIRLQAILLLGKRTRSI